MCTKEDGKFIWILHLKDRFSKFRMLYALTSNKTSEITFYINLFVRHLGVPDILQWANGREFQGALLLSLKKYNIKLINSRPRTPRTQGQVEQANAVVKDKVAKWKAANSTGDWADSLPEICDSINNQTHQSLPACVNSTATNVSSKAWLLHFSRHFSIRKKKDESCDKYLLRILIVFVRKRKIEKAKDGSLSLKVE